MNIQTSKLIRQIRAGLAGGNVEAPAESLAAEYVRLAQEAEQRLEACVAMLAKGSEYQALQLAETEPGLLDLIAALSFAEAPEWSAHCSAQGLPVAPKFDPKAIEALDDLYAKGISANHPLYKDYRAAVSSRDDQRALRTIRSIVRLNPGDANARTELTRLEHKVFQSQLQRLREALAGGEEGPILGALADLEPLAPAAKLAELPEFTRAAQLRRDVERLAALEQARAIAEGLPEFRTEGTWRKAAEALGQIAALQDAHGFTLEPAIVDALQETRTWVDAERAAAAETQEFQHSVAAVGMQAEQIETRLLTRGSLTLPEAENLLLGFNRGWKEVEKFGRAVPESVVQKVRASATALRTEVDRMQRQRRLRFGALAAAACVVLAVVGFFAVRAYQTREAVRQLAQLQSDGQVEAAEKLSVHLRTERPVLAAQSSLRAALDASDDWARGQRARATETDGQLAALEDLVQSKFSEQDPLAVNTRLETAAGLVEKLAAALRPAPLDRLAIVRNAFEAWVVAIRGTLAESAEKELTQLEQTAGNGLSYERDRETLATTLAQVEPPLKQLEARLHSPLPALELPPALQTRVTALRQRTDLFRKELDLLQQVRENLLQATTLEAYQQALGGFKESRLVQIAEIQAARKVLAIFPKPDEVLAALVFPGDPGGWATAKKETKADPFVPDAVLPVEITKLLAIREDNYLNDIWQMSLASGGKKREVFARGEVKKDGPRDIGGGVQNTRWTGAIYDPGVRTEVVAFLPQTVQINRNAGGSSGSEILDARISEASQTLARLELNRMTDSEGKKYERALLKVFDDLVRAKQASPIFRAYLMQQLGDLIELRPYAWGLQYCGILRADLARLRKLTGDAPLRSMDWLLERKRTELGGKLAGFFNELATRTYFAHARRHQQVATSALRSGLCFGGFLDGNGETRLQGAAAGARALWVVPESGGIARLDAKAAAKSAGLQFSPIFYVPLEAEAAEPPGADAAQNSLIPLLQ